VFDNNSSDDTRARRPIAGARRLPRRRQGKGAVVRRMFADIEADVYVMAPATAAAIRRTRRP
jgi:hypothetical protein